MKKNILIVFALVLMAGVVAAQKRYTLKVKISRIENVKAPLIVGLYADEASFKSKKALDSVHVVPRQETCTVTFGKLSPGEYAVALFQDIDGTGKLTTKEFGIPKEPVGISNYPLPGIPQPPKFKKAVFKFDKNMEIDLPLMFSKDYKKEMDKQSIK